jgi:DNA-binding response OmpR family regulator
MKVLVIEDDKKILKGIKKGLGSEGYTIDSAEDGLQGEKLARIYDYDVIILDILLPNQDGWETCSHLRKDKIPTPIIMLTALDDVSDRIKGLDTGADDYLSKPFNFNELLARIRALIRRRNELHTSVIEKYDVKLNLTTHLAFREGKEIKLSSKEFGLLELFMMNPDKILSKEKISEHLWDMNFNPKSNLIESFVKFLRRKIDKDFDPPLIHTIRGVGYIFSKRKY